MGSGGGGYYDSIPSREVKHQIAKSTKKLADDFDDDLQVILNEILPEINDRPVEEDNEFRNDVKSVLGEVLGKPIVSLSLGGSVAKNTYVEGLSDVDALAVFKDLSTSGTDPSKLLNDIKKAIKSNFNDCEVKSGAIAVTVKRPNGAEFQVIPAVRNGAFLSVPSWDGLGWSKIDPNKFRKSLTMLNNRLGMKLIPTIKLAKKVVAQLPESRQLSGYHMESLAIEVFKKYDGPNKTSKLLPSFFSKASDAVLLPIKDKSGQSRHVDDYLGGKHSSQRMAISHIFNRLAKRMVNASAAKSSARWNDILGEEND